MDLGAESNDRTERSSCGDPREMAAEEAFEAKMRLMDASASEREARHD